MTPDRVGVAGTASPAPTRPDPSLTEKTVRSGKPAGPAVFITEKQLSDTLRDACQWTGWKSAHFRPGRTSHGWRTPVEGDGKGFPDWVLVHDRGGVVFVELKTSRGKLSPAQEEWGEALIRAGAVYRVIRGMDELDAFCQELAERAIRR